MRIKIGNSDFYVGGGFYATTFEVQIGRLWVSLTYPQYWLYSRNRAKFLTDPDCKEWAKRIGHTVSARAWFFAPPGFIRLARKEDS